MSEKYKQEVLEAIKEAKIISHDPNTKRYGSFKEALEDLDDEKSISEEQFNFVDMIET